MDKVDHVLSILDSLLEIVKKITPYQQNYVYIKEEKVKVECVNFLKQHEIEDQKLVPYRIIKDYELSGDVLTKIVQVEAKSACNNLSSYEFSIASLDKTPYSEIECYGYDLNCNPESRIRPSLISPDSYAKTVSLQLNKAFNKKEDVKVKVIHKRHGISKHAKFIFTDGLNYKKQNLNEYTITIKFSDFSKPENIRVYNINTKKYRYSFVCKLFPINMPDNSITFIDKIKISDVKFKRVYIFEVKNEEGI